MNVNQYNISYIRLLICFSLLVPYSLSAQALIDLSIGTLDHQLEIRLVPQANFQGLVSNVQFTLKWNDPQLQLGEIVQLAAEQQYIPMQLAGASWTEGAFRYQTFVGFGLISMTTVNSQWQAEQEIVLMRIAVPSLVPVFELCQTEDIQQKNGGFYVELNGEPATGRIRIANTESQPVAISPTASISMRPAFPNPTSSKLFLPINSTKAQTLSISLYNQQGQKVYQSNWKIAPGQQHLQLVFPPLAPGIYHLFLRTEEEGALFNQKILIAFN